MPAAIRIVLTVAAIVLAGVVARGWLIATSPDNSALETIGGFDVAGALAMVIAVAAVMLLVSVFRRERR